VHIAMPYQCHGNYAYVSNYKPFKREYIGCVLRVASIGKLDDTVYALKHNTTEVSILSNRLCLRIPIPYLRVFVHKHLLSTDILRVTASHTRSVCITDTIFTSFSRYSEAEWFYIRHTLRYIGYRLELVHSNANDQSLRNTSLYAGISTFVPGHTIAISPTYTDISSSHIFTHLLLIHIFLSRTRYDDNQYTNDIGYLHSVEDDYGDDGYTTAYVEAGTVDIFKSGLDNVIADTDHDSHISVEEQLVPGSIIFHNCIYAITDIFELLNNSHIEIYKHLCSMYLSIVLYMLLWQSMYLYALSAHAYSNSTDIKLFLFKNIIRL
jgi:hypothetical protein